MFREITKDERKSRIKKCRRQRRPSKPQTPAVRTFFRYTVSGSNPESKSASGVRVPASAGGCKVPPGVIAKILVSRMTSIAFVARLGQLPLPSPSAAGKPTPLSRLDTPRKIYAALNKEEPFSGCLIYIIPPHQMKGKYINNTKVTKYSTLPFRGRRVISRYWREASIAFVWTSAYVGAQTFAVCGALPHTRSFLNFLITLRFWDSYSLPFSVLCVAE